MVALSVLCRDGSQIRNCADNVCTIGAITSDPAQIDSVYFVGELLGANKTSKTFEIRNMENDTSLAGKIADEIIHSGEIELTIGKLHNLTVREQISVSPITGEGKIERTLTALHSWHSDTASSRS